MPPEKRLGEVDNCEPGPLGRARPALAVERTTRACQGAAAAMASRVPGRAGQRLRPRPLGLPAGGRPAGAAGQGHGLAARRRPLHPGELERTGLAPAPAADRRTLIRRATFDLIGLPPTPEEVDAFLADDRPDAFARVVDRLLASPHYGERWGRHWLDVVRYADTAGDDRRLPRPRGLALSRLRHRRLQRATCPTTSSSASSSPATCCRTADPARRDARIIATGFLAIARRFGFDRRTTTT